MEIIFWVSADKEIVEFDNNATEEEIQEEFALWLDGAIQYGWYKKESEE